MPGDDLEIGQRIGDYRVIGKLAGGGYRAVHRTEPRRVQIDVASSREGWRDEALRMMRTARMLESMRHPGIARIVDRGKLADKRPWLAIELPSGIGLYELIAHRALSPAEIAGLVHDLADVLAHAHQRGLVHRALTLSSIVLTTGSREFPVCVVDWGFAHDQLGVYAAPEGATGDGRIDVYALGVIAYRAATRMFPLDAVTSVPGVPPGLATLIARMLAADPADRPTAAEVRALAAELLALGESVMVESVAAATRARAEEPDLMSFADEPDDRVNLGTGPRFKQPKWTPAPPFAVITETGVVIGELADKLPE